MRRPECPRPIDSPCRHRLGDFFCAAAALFVEAHSWLFGVLVDVLSVLSISLKLIGTVLALRQTDLKQLLAYSSIAHCAAC
jgi:NADH:ubiquinone oxidoreductase subunit 2 (subunit N)